HRVLGELEVTEDADEDRDGTSPLLAEDGADVGQERSTTGRTSIEPYSDEGIFAANSSAVSKSGRFVSKKPPICSFVSAKGPSVTRTSPSRTGCAVPMSSSSFPLMSGSAVPSSSMNEYHFGIAASLAFAASSSDISNHGSWSL